MQEVKHLHGNLGIGQKERVNIPLRQIFTNRGIIGKVTIMHQSLMETDKGVCSARVPDPAFRWVTMVPYPNVSMQVFKLIITNDIIAIAHHFKYQHILTVRENKSPVLSGSRIEFTIQPIGVLVDNFVFQLL